MNRKLIWITTLAFILGAVLAVGPLPSDASAQAIVNGTITGDANEYVVLYTEGASLASARAAVKAVGGTIIRENIQVGVATVRTANANFVTAVSKQSALAGASRNAPVGYAPQEVRAKNQEVEREGAAQPATAGQRAQVATASPPPSAEPLANLQWDMQMINATVDGSYKVQPGDRRVLVGVLDTGIDGSHPDIAPNFNRELSRNFTRDIEIIDGSCASDPDGSCSDPNDVDEDGHGTHVASTIAAPLNGLGIAGVAPNVTLVNLRAGQDSGYFFLQATVDALTYAGDIGVDVVNMSYYIDPWAFNCANNPADSPDEQLEQQTIIAATNRALTYAHNHGVTLIAALGNGHTNYDQKSFDGSSPDFPPNTEHDRTITNGCLDMPTEGSHVLSITAIGPSKTKADYSNYGRSEATVAAPGGYFRDGLGTPSYRTNENEILAAYPESVGRAAGDIDVNGNPTVDAVVRDCQGDVCAYYQYLQGTSMATPHAVGVAALIVSAYGTRDRAHPGGLTMDPDLVENYLRSSAVDTPCPNPRTVDYTLVGRPAEFNATCVGPVTRNSFYGDGIINALNAVRVRVDR
ncbi:MAG: S8 family serine peptidase [Thermomicrobiales bacterium]